MDHYLTISRVLYLWHFLMDNKNIHHIAEAARTRAKGLASIHMAKLSLPLLNIMDSSILTSGNIPCLMLSLEQCPGMLASPGHPSNIDIEGTVFTTWFPERCNTPAVNQQRWLGTVPMCVCWHCSDCWCGCSQRGDVWAGSPCPLTRHPQDSSPFVPGRAAVPARLLQHAHTWSWFCELLTKLPLQSWNTLKKSIFHSGSFFGLHNTIHDFSIYHS